MFGQQGDKSELWGATPDFLPQLSHDACTGLFTCRFHPSFRKMLCLFSTFPNSFAWKRISRAGTDTFPIGLPLPGSSVIAGFLQRSRRSVLLAFRAAISLPGRPALGFFPHSGCLLRRPKVPYLLPRRTARHPLPLTVSVFSASFTECGRAGLPEYPPEAQTGLTGCLEAWVSFVHRVGRVHDPAIKL